MDRKTSSLDDPSLLGWIAFAITGAFLLSFYLGFMRFLAGSWREFAALSLAALTYLAGLILLARLIHPRTAVQWRWAALMCPLVGGIAGAVYVGLSAATGAGPIVSGFAWGSLHGAFVAHRARRVPGKSSA